MNIPERLVTFVTGTDVAVWSASSGNQRLPDLARPTGVAKGDSDDELIIYIPQNRVEKMLVNIGENDQLALFCTEIIRFESYQFKGRCTTHWTAKDEEIESQKRLMGAFSEALAQTYGFAADMVYKAYFSVPIVALGLRVEQIFEQTPKRGTGTPIQEG